MAQTSPTEVAPTALPRPQGRSDPALLDTLIQLTERPLVRWLVLFLIALAILGQINFSGIDVTKRIKPDELGMFGTEALALAYDFGPEFDLEDRDDRPLGLTNAIMVVNWAAMPLTGVFDTTDGALVMVGAFKANPLRDISAALGIEDGLVRLSVGIEDEADLLADLAAALERARAAAPAG